MMAAERDNEVRLRSPLLNWTVGPTASETVTLILGTERRLILHQYLRILLVHSHYLKDLHLNQKMVVMIDDSQSADLSPPVCLSIEWFRLEWPCK